MRTLMRVAVALTACLLAGCLTAEPSLDERTTQPDADTVARLDALREAPVLTWDTSFGEIQAIAYTGHMPISAGHVVDLAASGFYDATIIHRVVDGFVVQGGDPTGTGEGGSLTLLPAESHPDLDFGVGSIGLAQWVPGTADAQWFFVEYPQPHLKDGSGAATDVLGPYPMIGQVVAGMDVVRAISEVDTLPNDRPIEDVELHSVTVSDAQAAGVDVLQLPQRLHEVASDVFVQMPQQLFTGHPFEMLFIDESAPSSPIEVTVSGRPVAMESIDGVVWTATLTMQLGDTLQVDGIEVPVDVVAWHAAYA